MNEERKIVTEAVEAVTPPPKARVSDAAESFARKKDYLEGFLAQQPAPLSGTEPGGDLYEAVIDALKEIYDPEIPVNIYDLGLIYRLDADEASGRVDIDMTLTAPACPVAESLPQQVRERVEQVDGVNEVKLELVWDPPWSQERMSEAARLELGML